jgi:hypothetical protein
VLLAEGSAFVVIGEPPFAGLPGPSAPWPGLPKAARRKSRTTAVGMTTLFGSEPEAYCRRSFFRTGMVTSTVSDSCRRDLGNCVGELLLGADGGALFVIEEPAFAVESAAVAGELAVGADYAMAGYDNGDWV